MGNCTHKPKSPVKFYQLSMPEFVYFDRKTQIFYNIKTKTITKLASCPSPNNAEIFTNYLTNSFYLITSNNYSTPLMPSNYLLRMPSMSLSSIKPLPTEIQILETVNSNAQLLVISTNPFNVFMYNTTQDDWIELAPLMTKPNHLERFSSCIYKKKLFVLCSLLDGNTFSDEVYSMALEIKSELKLMKKCKSPKLLGAKVHVKGNQIFVAGGLNESRESNQKFFFSENFCEWESVECGIESECEDCFFFESGKSICFVCFPKVFVVKNRTLIQFLAPGLEFRHDFLSTADNIPTKHFTKESSNNKSVFGNDPSQISASFILEARVMTPINQTLRETISSYDSDFDSQSLYSLEDVEFPIEKSISFTKNQPNELQDFEPPVELSKPMKDLKILSKTHNKEFLIDPNKASELLIFISDMLKIPAIQPPSHPPTEFSLYDLEKHLSSLKFKLFPLNTFNFIIQALDILLPLPHKITKPEIKTLKKLVGLKKTTKLIKKDNFVKGIIFRIKLSFTKSEF